MSAFGPGSPTKIDLYHMAGNDLRDVDRWTATGTNQTAAVAVDATYGVHHTSTLGGADNDEGSLTLDAGAIFHPAVGDKFELEALVKPTYAATDNMEWMVGFFDTLENVFTDTANTPSTTADFIGVGAENGSLFGRLYFGNDSATPIHTVSTIAITSGSWHRVKLVGEVQTDGIHARGYVNEKLVGTIGYGSGVAAQAVSGFTAMYAGITHKATDTDADVIAWLPLKLRVEQSGS